MQKALFGACMVSLSLASAGAWAQSNPSASSIIQSLTPHAGMTGGTRGIRPLAPAAEPPSAAPITSTPSSSVRAPSRPASAPPVQAAAVAAPSVNLTVQFATDSAQLTPQAERTLNELGRALSSQQLANYKFRVEGHTDTMGTPDHNQALSEARAKTVVDYLVSHFGIDQARLAAAGMGQSHLLVPTGQNVPEQRNRRVTVINVGA